MEYRSDCVKREICIELKHGVLTCKNCDYYIPRPGGINDQKIKMEKTMSNKLTNLNDALFKQLNVINGDLTDDKLAKEITRTAAICGISKQIIDNANLALKAHTTISSGKQVPSMLLEK